MDREQTIRSARRLIQYAQVATPGPWPNSHIVNGLPLFVQAMEQLVQELDGEQEQLVRDARRLLDYMRVATPGPWPNSHIVNGLPLIARTMEQLVDVLDNGARA